MANKIEPQNLAALQKASYLPYMNSLQPILRILLAMFLAICVAVHIIGFFYPVSNEPMWSHTVHILSYGLCLFTFLKRIKHGVFLYLAGMLYPFFFHARCAWEGFNLYGQFNAICVLVVVLLPAIGYQVWLKGKENHI